MLSFLQLCLFIIKTLFQSRTDHIVEMLALRHQLCVYQRSIKKPKIRPMDRVFWSVLARCWNGWRETLAFVSPETVIRWQRKRFRDFWTERSRAGKRGRPPIPEEIKELIRLMSAANPTWGSPRIVGELAKLGVHVAKSTVEKYRVRQRKPPSQTWRTFLKNHTKDIVSIDFIVVPTVRFKLLYIFLFLSVERRKIVHFAVTEHPTAQWAAQQVIEAFPWDTAPKYLLRDRDAIYGGHFRQRVKNMGIEEVLTAPHSPWQNPYSERFHGSLRRECLDHVIVLNEKHLKRIVGKYVEYYNKYRTHLSLDMDCPETRPVQGPDQGHKVVAVPQVGGLHHRYERRAA